jgi:hypothetical protein
MSLHADWGELVIATDVDRAVLLQLQRWLPTYLTRAEVERDLPAHLLARPNAESYQNVLEDDDFPDGRLPAILVTTAQTGDVAVGTEGAYYASWQVVVSVIVRGRTAPETREVAALFGGCVARILAHQQLDLDGEVKWTGASVAPVADVTDKGRWLAAGINTFTVYADQVISGDGPVLPTDDDPPYDSPDPDDPDAPYDPLVLVRAGGVTTTILPRS